MSKFQILGSKFRLQILMLTFISPFRTTQALTHTTSIRYTGRLTPPNVHKSESTLRPAPTTTSLIRASTTATTRELPSTSSLCLAHPLRRAGRAPTRPETRKSFRRSQTIHRQCAALSAQRRRCSRSILKSTRTPGS